MKKSFNIIFILVFTAKMLFAQDPQFSQFYSAPLYLGPSFAGTSEVSRVILNFRDQWPKLPGAFITSSFSADHFFREYNSGVGIMVLNDLKGGIVSSTHVALQYSYRIKIQHRTFIIPGIQFGYYMNNIKDLLFSDQIFMNEIFPSSIEILPEGRYKNFDFALSALGYHSKFWFGSTLDHLMKLSNSLEENSVYPPLKLSVYGGIKMNFNKTHMTRYNDKSLTYAFNYKTQDRLHQLDIGVYLTEYPLMVGLWYRGLPVFQKTISKDALAVMLGVKLGTLTIGYSYDFTVSSLINTVGGAHELSIVYKISNEPFLRKKIRAVPCPGF